MWWIACYVLGMGLLFAGLAGGRILSATWLMVLGGFGGVVVWFSALVGLVLLQQRDIQRVRMLGGQVCTDCLYDLSASPSEGNCPECGMPYTKAGVVRRWRTADRSYQAKKLYTLEEADE